jgi:4-hydroxybenzoate polyprenyltransferase
VVEEVVERGDPSRREYSAAEVKNRMTTHENVKAKGAMSMLSLLLLLSLAVTFLLNPETFKGVLKLLVIALIMLAGLAVASTPHPLKPEEVGKNGAI